MKPVRTAIVVTIFWTIVVGGMYPLLMYGVGIAFFPHQSQGSLLTRGGKVVGSALIGQDFSTDAYFHSRPSSIKYDPSSSGASNWGWTSADLKKAYTQNRADWQKAHGAGEPPMDMLFASGSGLDPHISPEAAELQVPGVSAARHIPADKTAQLLSLVKRFEEAPQLGFLGEPRVNVLRLNLALDATFPMQK
jgi:K+-transporting ATPase ATPase C chain